MLGFFGFGGFSIPRKLDMSPAAVAARQAAQDAYAATAVAWNPEMPFQKSLLIKGETYPTPPAEYGTSDELSPCGRWKYHVKVLPAFRKLATMLGKRRGDVAFTTDVQIPGLWERMHNDSFPSEPWMSMTPMEVFSLRAGTRLARGHVAIAGLGMGHQLQQVAARKQVKRITLLRIK